MKGGLLRNQDLNLGIVLKRFGLRAKGLGLRGWEFASLPASLSLSLSVSHASLRACVGPDVPRQVVGLLRSIGPALQLQVHVHLSRLAAGDKINFPNYLGICSAL